MGFRAIGSSYLNRQAPGSERVGGLTVTIHPRSDSDGEFLIELTDWRTGELLEFPDEVQPCADAAADGVRALAREISVEIAQFDIKLHLFLYHPVDSSPRIYLQAGRSAFRSALEVMRHRDI
jgi:hypothetical protein